MERHSDQVWLDYSKSHKTQALLDRAQRITGLPKEVVSGEESLQVLRYGKLGHYSCHYDSPPSHIPDGQLVRLGTASLVFVHFGFASLVFSLADCAFVHSNIYSVGLAGDYALSIHFFCLLFFLDC